MKSKMSITQELASMGVTVRSRDAKANSTPDASATLPAITESKAAVVPTNTNPEVTEGVRMALQGGRLVRTKTKKHSASERAKWRMAAKKPGAKAARKKLLKKPATKRKARLRAALMHKVESVEAASPGHRQVNAALSEAEELLAQHKANGESLALKGFAELALNSDLLSRAFRVFGEAYKSEDLLGLSAEYEQLGDQANAIVENLQADLKESAAFPDSHHLESTYRGMVDVVMDGCELYEIIGEELAEEVERASGNSLGN